MCSDPYNLQSFFKVIYIATCIQLFLCVALQGGIVRYPVKCIPNCLLLVTIFKDEPVCVCYNVPWSFAVRPLSIENPTNGRK